MVAIVSDGAGSATHAEIGSKTICIGFLRACRDFLARNPLKNLTELVVWDWIDEIRETINVKAEIAGHRPRDYAATLVALIAGVEDTFVIHVGDGAAVVRLAGSDQWEVPSWPFQGEYASTTAFVTDDPQPRMRYIKLDQAVDDFAVFSDGIERLVLDHVAKLAHAPFFKRMVSPLRISEAVGEDLELSRALESYLDSEPVCERTDDDKSLILGVRL